MQKEIELFVDADACPVKDEIIQVSKDFPISLTFVASYAHYGKNNDNRWVYVDSTKEAADMYIVNHVKKGDIVITQDMGLASLLTSKDVYVITPHGKTIVEENMTQILHQRYLSYKQIHAGKKVKGPKPFTGEDRQRFAHTLSELLSSVYP